MIPPEVYKAFEKEGAWAVLALISIGWVLRMAAKDREMLVNLMFQFKSAIDGLSYSVEKLGDRLESLEKVTEKHDAMAERMERLEGLLRDQNK
jgi:hypothetical protein